MRLTVKQPAPFWAEPVVSDYIGEQTAGTSTEVLEDSYVIDRNTGAEYAESKTFSYRLLHGDDKYPYTATYSSSDLGIATVGSNGIVTVVATGSCEVTVVIHGDGGVDVTHVVPIEVSLDSAIGVDYIDYKAATLGATLATDALAVINAATLPDTSRFSARNNSTLVYNRNANFYLSGKAGLSAMAVWNSRGTNQRGAVAITPRHVLYAAHFPLYQGDSVGFAEDGSGDFPLTQRTLSSAKVDPLYRGQTGGYSYDFGVAVLDSDLPAGFDPINLLPSDYINHCGQYAIMGTPSFGFNQDERASPTNIASEGNAEIGGFIARHWLNNLQGGALLASPQYLTAANGYSSPSDITTFLPPSSTDKMWELHVPIRVGDSGRQNVLLLGNQLLLTMMHTAPNAGINLSQNIDRINQLILDVDALAGISTGYTVTEADLSSYPTY